MDITSNASTKPPHEKGAVVTSDVKSLVALPPAELVIESPEQTIKPDLRRTEEEEMALLLALA